MIVDNSNVIRVFEKYFCCHRKDAEKMPEDFIKLHNRDDSGLANFSKL